MTDLGPLTPARLAALRKIVKAIMVPEYTAGAWYDFLEAFDPPTVLALLDALEQRVDLTTPGRQVGMEVLAREALARLAFDAVAASREGCHFDGGDIQDKAVKYGILVPTQRTEPCGEGCACAEFDDFPMTCYVYSDAAKNILSALNAVAGRLAAPQEEEHDG